MTLPTNHLRALACAAMCGIGLCGLSLAHDVDANPHAATASPHRYVVQRTFPKGALDGLDAATKARVNRTNAKYGVKWLMSFSNGDWTRTFCIYEGPTEAAIRSAAAANHLPVDAITEVPVTLEPR